jgi:hypothetical protein
MLKDGWKCGAPEKLSGRRRLVIFDGRDRIPPRTTLPLESPPFPEPTPFMSRLIRLIRGLPVTLALSHGARAQVASVVNNPPTVSGAYFAILPGSHP